MISILKEIKESENHVIDEYGNLYNKNNLNKPICQWIDNVGYKQSVIRVDGKRKYLRIHRLVAIAFIQNPDDLPQVNHIDCNKLNNNVDNLEWVDNKTNTQHGYDNNLYYSKKRSHPILVYDKLNDSFLYRFKSIRSLCADLGLNRKTVSNILNGTKETNNYPYIFEYDL